MANIIKEIIQTFDAIALVNGKKENITWLTSKTGKHYAVNENGERVIGDPRATGGDKKIVNKNRSKEKINKTIKKEGQSYKDDDNKTINGKFYGKNKIVKKSELEAYNNMPKGLKNIYDKYVNGEEQNTKQLDKVAKDFGMKLVGENSSLKQPKSFLRKVESDYEEYDKRFAKEEIAEKLFDINRYTMTASPDSIVDKANNVLKKLKEKGYKINKAKNGWLVPDEKNYYNGFNCQLVDNNGNKFELQFHTLNSFSMKEFGTHKYYEIERDKKSTSQQKEEANKIATEMVLNAKKQGKLRTPKDVENFAKNL